MGGDAMNVRSSSYVPMPHINSGRKPDTGGLDFAGIIERKDYETPTGGNASAARLKDALFNPYRGFDGQPVEPNVDLQSSESAADHDRLPLRPGPAFYGMVAQVDISRLPVEPDVSGLPVEPDVSGLPVVPEQNDEITTPIPEIVDGPDPQILLTMRLAAQMVDWFNRPIVKT